MSIAPRDTMNLRSFRSLMCRCSLGCCLIKVLTDLENYGNPVFYRHAGPKGPEEMSSRVNDRGGQAPALRHLKDPPPRVRRGPVPRRASVGKTALAGVRFSCRSNTRGGQAPALRQHRDREVSPTRWASIYETSSIKIRNYEKFAAYSAANASANAWFRRIASPKSISAFS